MNIRKSKVNKQSKYHFFHNAIKKGEGFTLIELIVVSGVVMIIITVAMDLFVSIIQYQRKVLSEQEISSQMSYVIEYMTRAVRMAKKDVAGGCLGPGNEGYNYLVTHDNKGIKFINHSDNDICQEFFWDNTEKRIKEIKNGGSALPLNSERVRINTLRFNISGDIAGDMLQPRVTIFIEAQTKGVLEQIKKQIQTTISQRNLDGP